MRPRPPSSTLFPYTTLFRSWMPGRIDEHHPVLVVKVLVTLHHDHETGAVLEGEPSAPVRKDVRIHACRRIERRAHALRSEEHTSELQSHSDLVCRLLLEKKK